MKLEKKVKWTRDARKLEIRNKKDPPVYSQLNIGTQDHNRRYKLILEIGLSKGMPVSLSPTRLIISIFHRLIGQYFESGILFISLANLHGGKR